LFGLDEEQIKSTIIYGENQSVISLAENRKLHSCSKHIELQFHLYEPKLFWKNLTEIFVLLKTWLLIFSLKIYIEKT
jgi:hypothetical protein